MVDASVTTSDSIVNALIHKRRMELNKHEYQMRLLQIEERKSNLAIARHRANFLQALKLKRKEWWRMDSFFRETLRKELHLHAASAEQLQQTQPKQRQHQQQQQGQNDLDPRQRQHKQAQPQTPIAPQAAKAAAAAAHGTRVTASSGAQAQPPQHSEFEEIVRLAPVSGSGITKHVVTDTNPFSKPFTSMRNPTSLELKSSLRHPAAGVDSRPRTSNNTSGSVSSNESSAAALSHAFVCGTTPTPVTTSKAVSFEPLPGVVSPATNAHERGARALMRNNSGSGGNTSRKLAMPQPLQAALPPTPTLSSAYVYVSNEYLDTLSRFVANSPRSIECKDSTSKPSGGCRRSASMTGSGLLIRERTSVRAHDIRYDNLVESLSDCKDL